MPIALAAVLMAVGPVLMVVVAIGVPVLFALMVREIVDQRRAEIAAASGAEEAVLRRRTEAAETRMHVERGVARGFVIFGGVFWMLAAVASFERLAATGVADAFVAACIPLLTSLVTLVIGWYWERLAAVGLLLASFVTVYWAAGHGFELGVWLLLMFSLIGPMVTASVLFWLARREYEALAVLGVAHPESVRA